jgi:zinc/manganese transport system substrate-binding protein
VVTTHTVLANLVTAVGGDRVEVKCLLPINLDPHSYEPKPADIRLLAHADLVVINGLGLEPWAEKVIANSGFHGTIVTATQGLPRILAAGGSTADVDGAHPPEHYDPHAWHNPRNAIHYVAVIRAALTKAFPIDAEIFRLNADRYTAQLEEMDAYARKQFDAISPENRKLVTSHDSLRYLADAYGLTIVPVAGTRPDQEPSARQLAELIGFIRSQHVRAVFFEATASPKLVELVAREAGVTVIGQLYSDSLGPIGSPGASYLGMFRSNVDTLVQALK